VTFILSCPIGGGDKSLDKQFLFHVLSSLNKLGKPVYLRMIEARVLVDVPSLVFCWQWRRKLCFGIDTSHPFPCSHPVISVNSRGKRSDKSFLSGVLSGAALAGRGQTSCSPVHSHRGALHFATSARSKTFAAKWKPIEDGGDQVWMLGLVIQVTSNH